MCASDGLDRPGLNEAQGFVRVSVPSVKNVVIVGAGIGGLTTAIAMARNGIHVQVVEHAQELKEVGAGIQLSPNAMKVLNWLGLDRHIESIGQEPQQAVLRHYKTGRTYLKVPLGDACRARYGAPFLQVHRADLLRVLADAAGQANVEIQLGRTFERYDQDAQGKVSVDGIGPADLLIGADGLRSRVRTQMLGEDAPRFTGQTAWRATIPASALPRDAAAPAATVWVGPGGHVVTYPLRGGDMVNLVAVREKDTWTDESWTQPGDPSILQEVLKDWHPNVRAVSEAVTETHLWALYDRSPLPRWSEGSVCLLGDACHPTLPFLAQGACMAMEDASVLTRLLLMHELHELHDALAAYEKLRKPRTTMLQAKARSNASLYHLSGGAGDVWTKAKLNASAFFPGWLAHRLVDPIYGYDPLKD